MFFSLVLLLGASQLGDATDKSGRLGNSTTLTRVGGLVKVRGITAEGTGRFPTWLGEVPMSNRWPGGIVPYTYSSLFTAAERYQFDRAIADYNKYTCIKFIPRTDQYDYIFVQGEFPGCFADVDRKYMGRSDNNGKPIIINLARNSWCTQYKSIAIHELWHGLGLVHYEDYLEHVKQENIFPGQDPDTFGLPDYNNPPREEKDGGLTALEKFRIRRMYKCYGSSSLLNA